MARREPITDETRQAILAAVRAGGASCRAIATRFGVSAGYVSKLAKAEGLTFDRERTAPAAAARRFDARAARARAVEDLYGDFQRFRQRAWSPYTQIVATPAGPELITTKLPPLREQQSAMTAAAICLDKALVLERHDESGGAQAGRTMVNELFGALGLAHLQLAAETGELPEQPEGG